MNRGGSHLRDVDLEMTWLILGSSGQLGIAVSQELGERVSDFRAWSRRDLNVTQGPIVEAFVAQLSPRLIVNCAAWTDVDRAESNEIAASRVNSDGAENIAVAAKECGARFIHISTDYVFSGEGASPWEVDDVIVPKSAYGRTKAEGEARVVKSYPDNSFIVRTAWLYSPWGKNFAKTLTRLAIKGEGEVKVVNDQFGQPTSAIDLAKQLVELGLSDAPVGIYHGTNSGQATWFEFAQEIFKLAGADARRIVPIPSSEYPRPAKRPTNSVLSHKAWAKTSIEPMRDWRIALAEAMPSIISTVEAEE
jgi:dTDP-4-dehydrorhamnose reductase